MKTSGLKLCLAVAAFGVMSTAANAVTYFSVPFDINGAVLPSPAAGQSLVTNFDSEVLGQPVVAAGYTWSSVGGGLYNPPLVSGIAAPVPNDPTQYFAVLAGGQATLKSTSGILSNLSVLLGSLDTYNQLIFRDSNGVAVASYSGSDLYPPATGDQFAQSTNREFYFSFAASEKITEVDFNSYGNSFEFDNIYASAVPEPAVWLMMIAGFGLTGLMLRQRAGVVALAV